MTPLGIVVTVIVLLFVLMFLRYIVTDPYTLQSIANGKNSSTISASSLATNGSDVPSSNFAYSVWFYINNWNYRYGEPKVIFGRMGALSAPNKGSIEGVNGLDPCPAVVLGAVENSVNVSIGCFPGKNQQPTGGGTTVVHTCTVANVPIQKWVNLVMSVYGRSMDLYIDGKLVRTCLLPGVANVSTKSDIYMTPAGGFDGWTAKLQYYPTALNPQEVWNIYSRGYSSWFSFFNSYQVEIALKENGVTQSSVSF